MTASLLIASGYLGQLGLKVLLAMRYARRVRSLTTEQPECSVSILQPILGGDPNLAETLAENLKTFPDAHFIWLVDTDDPIGGEVCERLAAMHPGETVSILRCAPPAQGVNPKAHKLALAVAAVTTPVFVVLDDDTRLTVPGLRALVRGLNNGATLTTGLPRYRTAAGSYSSWLAEFVNSAAVLTYLPILAFAEPISIQGMCYAMRTNEARRLDVFGVTRRALTDDLALALELRCRRLKIQQTLEPHDTATSVPTFAALGSILHRWFVFTRLLVEDCSWRMRGGIVASYALPPLLLLALFILAPLSVEAAGMLAAVLLVRDLILRFIKRYFLGKKIAHGPVVSVLLEIMQPVFLTAAYLRTTIQWRNRTIRVRAIAQLEYL